jgi:hypothetical protein
MTDFIEVDRGVIMSKGKKKRGRVSFTFKKDWTDEQKNFARRLALEELRSKDLRDELQELAEAMGATYDSKKGWESLCALSIEERAEAIERARKYNELRDKIEDFVNSCERDEKGRIGIRYDKVERLICMLKDEANNLEHLTELMKKAVERQKK